MIIASFNANGVRARMPVLQDWLSSRRPDVLCLQETKVQDADFPREVFERIGYHCTVFGQKAYNGVAVLSREAPAAVRMGFDDGAEGPEEARLVAVRLGRIDIVNTYVPQGQAPDSEKFTHKLAWLARLRNYFERFYLPEPLWCGPATLTLRRRPSMCSTRKNSMAPLDFIRRSTGHSAPFGNGDSMISTACATPIPDASPFGTTVFRRRWKGTSVGASIIFGQRLLWRSGLWTLRSTWRHVVPTGLRTIPLCRLCLIRRVFN